MHVSSDKTRRCTLIHLVLFSACLLNASADALGLETDEACPNAEQCSLSMLQRRAEWQLPHTAVTPESTAGRTAATGDTKPANTESTAEEPDAAKVSAADFPAPPRVSATSKFFLWLTDVHVDLYYGRPGQQCSKATPSVTSKIEFGMIGCDPPLKLMESTALAASEAAAAAGGAEFVLFTGDFTRHRQDRMPDPSVNVTATISRVSHTLAGIDVTGGVSVGSLGNDDFPRDYELRITSNESRNPWLSDVATVFADEGVLSGKALQHWTYGGFFEQEVADLTVLTINTIIYSVRHIPPPPDGAPLPADPFGQLAWLRGRLERAAARGRPVWIVGHIPPGMETYGYTELWHPQYLLAYRSLLQQPALGAAVAAQLFGHVHAEELRLWPSAPEAAGPVLLAGAISPVYRSNPTFRLVEYDPVTKRLLNYLTYYTDISESKDALRWKLGYSAVQVYEALDHGVRAQGALFHQAYDKLAAELALGERPWNTYAGWYKVQYINDLMYCGMHPQAGNKSLRARRSCIMAYVCGLHILTQQEYDNCRSKHASVPDRSNLLGQALEEEEYEEEARRAHLESLGN